MFTVERTAEAHSWVVLNEHGTIVCQTQSEEDAIAEACRLADLHDSAQIKIRAPDGTRAEDS